MSNTKLLIYSVLLLILAVGAFLYKPKSINTKTYCREIMYEFLKHNNEFKEHTFIKSVAVKKSIFLQKLVNTTEYGSGNDHFCYFEKVNDRRLAIWLRIQVEGIDLGVPYHSKNNEAYAISISAIDDTVDGIDRLLANQTLWEMDQIIKTKN